MLVGWLLLPPKKKKKNTKKVIIEIVDRCQQGELGAEKVDKGMMKRETEKKETKEDVRERQSSQVIERIEIKVEGKWKLGNGNGKWLKRRKKLAWLDKDKGKSRRMDDMG